MDAAIRRTAHFDEAGAPGSPSIVLLHGSVVTRTIWRPQLLALGSTFHMVAPDLPGHGSRATTPFSFDAAVDQAADLIAAAGGRAILVGLSLGGYVAMRCAARHPRLVSGLVVCGASVNFIGPLALYLKVMSRVMARGWLTPNPARLERKTRALFPPALGEVADLQIRDGLYPAPLAAAFREMAGTDFRAVLAAYPGPVLIVNGEFDRPARKGEAAFAAAAHHARVQTIPGAGHACNLGAPHLFNAALSTFARDADA